MRKAVVASVVFVVGAALAGCAPPPPPPPDPVSPQTVGVAHTVGVRDVTFVDTTRPTSAFAEYPGSPSRTLPTTIWYPTDPADGPYPLLVFAHGFGVTPAAYDALLTRIARAGYVVAAPTYPILSGEPAGPSDVVDWTQTFPDTTFVTTKVLELSASGDSELSGLIDPQRIAVAGHSDGAYIAFGDGYEPFRLDPRVRAVISFAADLSGAGTYQPNARPFLHFLSDDDEYNPYGAAIAWDREHLSPPKWTVTLLGAGHESPYVDPADAHFDLVVRTTIEFLDSTLKAHPETMFYAVLDIAEHSDLAAME